MERRELLYEGKAKQVYRTADPDLLIQHFKDDATAFNAQKRGTIASEGRRQQPHRPRCSSSSSRSRASRRTSSAACPTATC